MDCLVVKGLAGAGSPACHVAVPHGLAADFLTALSYSCTGAVSIVRQQEADFYLSRLGIAGVGQDRAELRIAVQHVYARREHLHVHSRSRASKTMGVCGDGQQVAISNAGFP